jgi:hypothetical protein
MFAGQMPGEAHHEPVIVMRNLDTAQHVSHG